MSRSKRLSSRQMVARGFFCLIRAATFGKACKLDSGLRRNDKRKLERRDDVRFPSAPLRNVRHALPFDSGPSLFKDGAYAQGERVSK